ncbi:tripartite tricarboxylate transporter substrate binding protein [Alkalihalobacillus sp. BA299]|uniref:Bug family tripartite tricarboxylate transporter substrate binding protein n=1 Tax=Alkalihalobacillus sp. BA299 TaxID=2815938 RepID=UPI001ADBB651|nr:tripartite tricarboxylate transporter substrate binding protein [Alkalihalobacillus sp. BA299]
MLKKVLLPSLVLLLMSILLIGCGSEPTNETQNETPNEETPQNSGNEQAQEDVSTDDYPNEPLNIIIPFSPGVAGDTFVRTFARAAESYLGQNIVPINRDGGSGMIGVVEALNADPDGYTIVYQSSTLPYKLAAGEAPFETSDLVAISTINADYQVLAVRDDSPFETFEDFKKYAEENPGKLNISGSGSKGTNHVLYMKMVEGAGIEANYVTYAGGSQSLTAVLGGEVDALVGSSSVVNQYVDTGEVRILAVTGNERAENRPDIPTFKELGVTNIEDEFIWRGFFGHKDIPQERLEKLNEIIGQAIQDPIWLEYMEAQNQMNFYKDATEATDFFNNFTEDAKVIFENLE